MANFVYNPYRSDGSQRQWYDFQQKKSFHDDLVKTFQTEAKNISKAISESTSEIVGSLDEGFNVVTDILGSGFSAMSGKIDSLNSSIENLALMLDWRLSEVINQQKISNLLLKNVALLLRVPDFQKERQYYIEQGFKHYKNASLDADLYEDALKNLLEAEKREVADYIVLYQIGMIYLYSTKEGETQNLVKAEEYLRRAAKYAVVESNPEAQKTLNILAGEANQNISMSKAAKAFAARAYFQAAIACYAQGKFAEAADLSEKAYSLLPSLLEAGFLQAKSLAALDKAEESAEILRGVIQAQPFIYALKTASDGDLEPKSEVRLMLEVLRDIAISQASEKLTELKAENINDLQFIAILSKVESLIQKNTFLDALIALDELKRKRKWQIDDLYQIIYERFLQNNPNLRGTADTGRKLFNKYWQNSQKEDVLVRSHQKNNFLSVEDFILVHREITHIVKQKVEVEKQALEEDEKLLLRLEQDRKQINEFILQAQKEEGRNLTLAIRLYEQAAKLGSCEAGQKLQDLKKSHQKQTSQNQITEFLLKAQTEEEIQNQKWVFKNYNLAIYFYEQAEKLGSYEAKQRLQDLKRRLGINLEGI